MKLCFKTWLLAIIAASTVLTACSDGPSELAGPGGTDAITSPSEDGATGSASGDGTASGQSTPPKWATRQTGTPELWMLDVVADFQTMLEDLGSSDPAVAAAAAQELMSLDPNIYPDALRALTAQAPDHVRAIVEADIAAYWEGQQSRPEVANRCGGGEWTFQLKGEIRTLPPSTVTIRTLVYDHVENVAGGKFPFDTGESAHTCQRLVFESESGVEKYPYHLKFSIPGNLVITGIDIDINLEIDLTLILRYYECPKDCDGHGDDDEDGDGEGGGNGDGGEGTSGLTEGGRAAATSPMRTR